MKNLFLLLLFAVACHPIFAMNNKNPEKPRRIITIKKTDNSINNELIEQISELNKKLIKLKSQVKFLDSKNRQSEEIIKQQKILNNQNHIFNKNNIIKEHNSPEKIIENQRDRG